MKEKDLKGFSGYSPLRKAIIVAFRGTDNVKNILTDVNYQDVDYPNCNGCKVHKGFYLAYQSIKELMLTQVNILAKKYPGALIYTTGHSLGGSLATFAAADLSKTYKLGDIFTFGKPRLGNKKFADWINSFATSYRVIHNHDIVPSIPPQNNPVNSIVDKISNIKLPKLWHFSSRHDLT